MSLHRHDHWYDKNGFKLCPICGQRFDIPIKPVIVNIYEDESPASSDNGVRRRVGQD